MSEYQAGSAEDRAMLEEMSSDKLRDYFFLQIRNLWRVDGLYFLGIEKKFRTEAATEIDSGMWETMAGIEARSLQKMFRAGENSDVATIMDLLQKSGWALDQPLKTITVRREKAVLGTDRCRTQETRSSKGLDEFPCKKVRCGYLERFAKTLNPKVKVNCLVRSPDKHPKERMVQMEICAVILGFWRATRKSYSRTYVMCC